MTRFVVTGAGGQLGVELVQALQARSSDVVALTRSMLDVTDRTAVHAALRELAPDVVLNAAAMTAVDRCETDPDDAFAANTLAPRWIVEACDDVGAKAVLFSTDYVFSGELARPYHEWDLTGPLSVYGLSKLAGEQVARPGDLVIRTSWLCGAHGSNILKTVLSRADQGLEMAFVTDQIGHPSMAGDVAEAVVALVESEVDGVVHVTNQGSTSWYEFVQGILSAGGLPRGLVRPITTDELTPKRPAPRPMNSVLDNSVIRLLGLPETRPWQDAVVDVVRAIRE